MKQFRKNEFNYLICEECNRIFKSQKALSKHIIRGHKITLKEYYDKWLKENDEGQCKICQKETKFMGARFYQLTCSRKCYLEYNKQVCIEKYGVSNYLSSKVIREKIQQTNLKKYGTINPSGLNINNKFKDTCLKKYGVENPYQSPIIKEKIKETNLKKYGVENPNFNKEIREKIKQTCLKKYGVEYALQNKEIREKGKQTIMQKYGVEHQSQNKDIHIKQMKTGKRIKLYKDTDLWYQGSYELDFLEKYYNKFPDIKRGPSIKYVYEGKNKIYYPDFYIPSLNLIIEIKNSYYVNKDKNKIKIKEQFVIKEGYSYCIIINKDYTKFIDLIL
jgi:uncharacterized C2H2 Zn-finger protein